GLESRHNLTYWRYEEYVGIGPGAHGRVLRTPARPDLARPGLGHPDLGHPGRGRLATRRASGPEAWIEQVEARGHGTAAADDVVPEEAVAEALMMGLRLREGIDRARFRRLVGPDPATAVDPDALARLVGGGFLAVDDTTLRATDAG